VLNLDPGKVLIIGVVAILILGPDRLPQVARQIGGTWRSFNSFRQKVEAEVRSNMPDLPSTTEIVRLARSPSALLDNLANMKSSDGPLEASIEGRQTQRSGLPTPAAGVAGGAMSWVTADLSEPEQMSSDPCDSKSRPTMRSQLKPSDREMSPLIGFDASLN
jgi:Sec-independent protein translocase protein TatA